MALHRDGGQDRLAHEVMAGQHYVQVNAYRNVWEVRDVFHLSDDIAHARLARVDEPTIMKTVSCISLVEGALLFCLPAGARKHRRPCADLHFARRVLLVAVYPWTFRRNRGRSAGCRRIDQPESHFVS